MKNLINDIQTNIDKNILQFNEQFYYSIDKKSILGEIPFKEIIFLEYRDSDAGSNPREYIGLKKTNLNILKSLLKDYENMFRFLHSGLIVSITNPKIDIKNKTIKYDECCLTNGNQTRFILLIIILLKIYSAYQNKDLTKCTKESYSKFVNDNFNSIKALSIINKIKFSKVNEIIRFLINNSKYLRYFENINIKSFINSKLRIQLNLIDNIISDLDDKLNEYEAGTLIAEANNDTQKVKVDDIFGNKYRTDLENKIFDNFIAKYSNIRIEYRLGEVIDTTEKIHILTLLRPVIATGILCKEKEIFNLSNKRDPIYKIFEKLLRHRSATKTIRSISLLIPFLHYLRISFLLPTLIDAKRKLMREYKEKAHTDEIDKKYIMYKDIQQALKDDTKLTKIIKTFIGYNTEHIFPVLIYTIKKLFFFNDEKQEIDISVHENYKKEFLNSLIDSIYYQYVETKMRGLPTSLTTFVRDEGFFKFGQQIYTYLKRQNRLTEKDYIDKNKIFIEL